MVTKTVEVKETRYFKVLAPDNKHYKMVYKPNAWNTDVLPYNPTGDCEQGGLYFAPINSIVRFLHYGDGICEVLDWRDDQDQKTFHEEDYKVKAHKIKLGKKKKITTEFLNELLELGADPTYINTSVDYLLRHCTGLTKETNTEVLKAIMNSKLVKDVQLNNWFSIAFTEDNHPIMEFLLEKGINIHFENDVMTYKAIMYNDEKSLSLFLKYGGDVTTALNTHTSPRGFVPASEYDIVKLICYSGLEDIILEHYIKEDGTKYTKDEIYSIKNGGN